MHRFEDEETIMSYQSKWGFEKTLAKDSRNKKLAGVCAGVANYYQQPVNLVRALALVALLLFPMATGVAYGLAGLLLPEK